MNEEQIPRGTSRRVLLTGVGLHGAFGGADETWQALSEGRTAVSGFRLPSEDGFPDVPAASAAPFSLGELVPDRKLVKYMSPTTALAVLAAGRALSSAGLLGDCSRLSDAALFVATGLIGFDLFQVAHLRSTSVDDLDRIDYAGMGQEGLRRCHPLMPFKMLLNMPLGLISIVYGIRGENFILYPGADQAGACLETAIRGIRQGRFSRAVVGGSAQPLSMMPLCTLLRAGRVAKSPGAAEPYRPEHAGIAPADAGAFVVLESAESTAERGARAIAEVRAVTMAYSRASTADAAGPEARRQELLRDLWREAAGSRGPDGIVSTGSLDAEQDSQDEQAARSLWPSRPRPPALSSFDGRLGHGSAAAPFGALVLASLMIDRQAQPGNPGDDLAPPIRELLVSAREPRGGMIAVCIAAPERGA